MEGPLRIATRTSRLARWQAERVAQRLGEAGRPCELVGVSTVGDRRGDVPIHAMGGTGVFVREVQQAVLDGRAEVAVHSAKDLPAEPAAGLRLACVPERADPRDALVGSPLATLRAGAVVATGSVRRRAQLAALVPGLEFADLRGNIETRLDKARDFDAIVVAYAALERLGLAERATDVVAVDVMVPQVAQGALAVEARSDDEATLAALASIDDELAHACVDAERAFLAALGGGCDRPLGAYATRAADGTITLLAVLADDAGLCHRVTMTGTDTHVVGTEAAIELASRTSLTAPDVTQDPPERGGPA